MTFEEETKCEASDEGDGAAVGRDQEPEPQGEAKEDQDEDSDCVKAETVLEEERNENPAPEEQEAAEMTEHSQTSEPQEASAACSDENPAPDDGENKRNSSDAVEVDAQPQETGQEAETGELKESPTSELDKRAVEKAALDDAEAEEMTAESSEGREALSCEEESVPHPDRRAASQTEVTAGDSSSSLDGSGDTMVENATDVKENGVKAGGSEVDVKEEEEEQTSKSDPENGHVEKETSENEDKEEEKETDPEESTKNENESCESKTTEKENENIPNSEEDQKTDLNHETQISDQTNDVMEEEKGSMEGKSVELENKDDENLNTERKSEAGGDEVTETRPGEEDKVENHLKDESENGAEQSEQRDKECGDENSPTLKNKDGENTEEPEKNTENQSEDEGHSEAAGETKRTDDDVVETEGTKEENEGGSTRSERRKIDAENGEISPAGEASDEDGKDWNRGELGEDGRQTEEPSGEKSEEVKPEVEEEDEGCGGSVRKQGLEQEINVEPDTSREESEGTKQDENKNRVDVHSENRDSESSRDIDKITDMAAASTPDQPQSSATNKPHESTGETPEQTRPHENTDGGEENGGDEEASKASEEGASVLFKPQAPQDEAETAEQTSGDMQSPEVLTSEVNTDLVSNWINMHQRSKFFETFVEPLEDLGEDSSNTGVSMSTEQHRSESPLKMSGKCSSDQNDQNEEGESRKDKNTAITLELPDKPQESDLDIGRVQREVKDMSPKTETSEPDGGSKESLREDREDRLEEHRAQGVLAKTEVESIIDTQRSMASLKQGQEKAPGLNGSQTEGEKAPSLVPEEPGDLPVSSDAPKDTRETLENPDFTAVRSDNGSQAASSYRGVQTVKQSDSVSGELIRDTKQLLSKEGLSSYSVDETLLGHSSYPLLSSARTESLH